jgi:TetR/AcrR family transcriptional regulator, fatty acid metabolism regulator protein
MVQYKKLTSRQAQAIKTKNKIYKTAVEMMQKKDFDDITIENISKKAGVSVGSFYYYFKSKNDILMDIFHQADVYFDLHIGDKFDSKTSVEQILVFFKLYAQYSNHTNIDFTKKLYNTENKAFINRNRRLYQILLSIIKKGQENGEFINTMSDQDIADYLFITARGIVFDWCLHEGDYDLDKLMADYMERLIKIFLAH